MIDSNEDEKNISENSDVIDATIMGVYQIIQKYSKREDMKEPFRRIQTLKERRHLK